MFEVYNMTLWDRQIIDRKMVTIVTPIKMATIPVTFFVTGEAKST